MDVLTSRNSFKTFLKYSIHENGIDGQPKKHNASVRRPDRPCRTCYIVTHQLRLGQMIWSGFKTHFFKYTLEKLIRVKLRNSTVIGAKTLHVLPLMTNQGTCQPVQPYGPLNYFCFFFYFLDNCGALWQRNKIYQTLNTHTTLGGGSINCWFGSAQGISLYPWLVTYPWQPAEILICGSLHCW